MARRPTSWTRHTREVVLTLTLTCTLGDQTAYLAEVQQAGIFSIAGFSAEDEESMIGSYCPNVLFPFARQIISAMIQDGGFPPFLLQPINFDALYAAEQQRRMAGAIRRPRSIPESSA